MLTTLKVVSCTSILDGMSMNLRSNANLRRALSSTGHAGGHLRANLHTASMADRRKTLAFV